ncbi:type II secretion system inner membrane protein GspF [Azonexus hydrophilus]|uniref:type II secretion system inner membrane protein GspF n=1 Tax=Azonexus hydrophilus TaxID=418702 RepID=UPI000403163D|nr:type II secretion system inner membrane protein GspF [Azonexus hydrophilus]
MSSFRYRAITPDGREVAGVIDADSARQARGNLRQQGLAAYEVVAAGSETSTGVRLPSPRLGNTALMLLTRQWATLLAAGIPVEQALAALIEQSEEVATRTLLTSIRDELRAGHPLHRALAKHPRSFGSLYCALVAAGEQSGQLDRVMLRLADNLESSGALRQKVLQATIYPALVVLVASAVVAALMLYVVPQVVAVFQSGKQTLPLLTRLLIATSDLLRLTWPGLLVGAVIAAWSARGAWRRDSFRQALQGRLIRLPVVGKLAVAFDSARLAQTLAILVGSGVPLLTALQAAGAVIWLLPLRQALATATTEVREGASLQRALGRSRQFPPLLVHMIGSGESSGQLGDMLDKAARQQNDEVAARLGTATSLLEPLLILGMGGIVLIIVLAILQPIIEVNQLLH